MRHPQEKASILIQEINSMIDNDARDEARIVAIEQEVQGIANAGCFYQAKQVLGMIASMRGDANGVRQQFEAAMRASGNDILVRLNFARALSNVQQIREAICHIGEAVRYAPDDLDVLLVALDIHQKAYDVQGSEELIERISRLGMEHLIPKETIAKLNGLADLLKSNGASWEDITDRIELATRVLLKEGRHIKYAVETSFGDSVLMDFFIEADEDVVASSENAIHIAIANQSYNPADRIISFSCTPA